MSLLRPYMRTRASALALKRTGAAGPRARAHAANCNVHGEGLCYQIRTGQATKVVLRDVDIAIAAGQLHMLVGDNGCGKSTLLRLIGGLLEPTVGHLHVAGACACVFQNPDNQLVMPTVASEVALGMGSSPLPQAELRSKVEAVLSTVGLEDFAESATHTLSGGQKQRLAIAAALAQGEPVPKVLLLDELTTYLDTYDAMSVLQTVRKVLSDDPSMSAVWVTHRMDELPYAAEVIYLQDGRVEQIGPPEQILQLWRRMGATVY